MKEFDDDDPSNPKDSSDDQKDDNESEGDAKSGSDADDWPDGDARRSSKTNPESERPTDEQKVSSDDGRDDTGPGGGAKSVAGDWPDGDANPLSDKKPEVDRPTDEQMDRQNAKNIIVMRTEQEILRQQKDDDGVRVIEDQIQKVPVSDDIKTAPQAYLNSQDLFETTKPTDEQMDRQNAKNIIVMRTEQEILRQQKDDDGVRVIEDQIQKVPVSDDIKTAPQAYLNSQDLFETTKPTDEQMDRQNAKNIIVMRTEQEILRQQKDDDGVQALETGIQRTPVIDAITTSTIDLTSIRGIEPVHQVQVYDNSIVEGPATVDATRSSSESELLGDTTSTVDLTSIRDIEPVHQVQVYDNSVVEGPATVDAPRSSSKSELLGDTTSTIDLTSIRDIEPVHRQLDDTRVRESDEMRPLSEYRSQHPDMFREPLETDPFPEVTEAFSSPDLWVDRINPRGPYWNGTGGEPGRDVNCVDCARAVERAWRGDAEISAANLVGGEQPDGIEDWLGTRTQEVSFNEISERLQRGGHGSSALILGEREGLRGHAFNAVNYQGQILFVDAQPIRGAVDYWPPKRTSPGFRYREDDFAKFTAVVRDGSRRIIR